MSIVVVCRDKDDSARIVLGYSSAGQEHGTIVRMGKYGHETDNWIVMHTGSAVGQRIIERAMLNPEMADKQNDIQDMVLWWKDLLENHGFDIKRDNAAPYSDNQFIVVDRRTSEIFWVGGDFLVDEVQEFWAIGSGRNYALGAMRALRPLPMTEKHGHLEITTERRVRRAVEAALWYDVYCNGSVNIAIFELSSQKQAAAE